jgi:regulator of sigma E protease
MEGFLNVLQFIGYLLLAFVCLSVMVVLHELGHFIAGRKLGFKINEFAVGMGPKIISKKLKSGLILSWRLIPVGGFCAFEGEDEENPSPEAFNNQKPWKRLIVLAAGVATNFISAMVVLSLFFTFSGQMLPYIAPTEGGQAAEFGIEYGDVVTKVDGKSFQMLEPSDFTGVLNGKDEVKLTVLRGKTEYEITLTRHVIYEVEKDAEGNTVYNEDGTPKIAVDENGGQKPLFETDKDGKIILDESGNPKPLLKFGISVGQTKQTFGFFESIYRAVRFSFFTVVKILSALGSLVTGSANVADTAGGPVTMISGLASVVSTGLANTIYIVCLFSINLAIFNILPLPAMDGGRIVFTVIEWIRKKPIKPKVEAMIHFVGIVALLGMAIIFDIIHFISLI